MICIIQLVISLTSVARLLVLRGPILKSATNFKTLLVRAERFAVFSFRNFLAMVTFLT